MIRQAESIQVVFKPDKAEINDAVMLLLRKRLPPILALSLLFAIAAVFFFVQGTFREIGFICAVIFLLMLLIIVRFVISSRSSFAKTYDAMGEQAVYTFDDSGIKIRSNTGEAYAAWDSFTHYTYNENTIILQQQNRSSFILPTRAFTSQQREVLETYLQRIPGRK